MIARHVTSLWAAVALLSLLVATTDSALAAPQPPVKNIVKKAGASSILLDGTLGYEVAFEIGPGGGPNVLIQDTFQRGIDLLRGEPVTFRSPSGTTTITPTLISNPNDTDRRVYNFPLGDLAEGSYGVLFQARMIPGKYTPQSAKGKAVRNEAAIFVGGQRKGSAFLNTDIEAPVVAAPRPKGGSTQGPILVFVKTPDASSVPLDGTLGYQVSFEIDLAGAENVVVQDTLQRGLDLLLGQPITLTGPAGTTSVTPTLISDPNRKDRREYNFPLGDLGEGFYALSFQATMIPGFYTPQSAEGKSVRNEAIVKVGGNRKGSRFVDTPIQLLSRRSPADPLPPELLTGTQRVSLSSSGVQANNISTFHSISADGRFEAFASFASNLVPSDTNEVADIFVHDRQTRVTQRVNVATGGGQANGGSTLPSLSANGRFAAFDSVATNLVESDTNGVTDIFVHDRQTGVTQRVSVATGGAQANGPSVSAAISANGRFVAFESDANNLVPDDTNGVRDVFLHDRQTGVTERVSVPFSTRRLRPGESPIQANGPSQFPSVSADGSVVAFFSRATNLVENDTNGTSDVFVRDRVAGKTERVSVATGGGEGNGDSFPGLASIGASGRFVAFESLATNLVPNDTNGVSDVFVRDRVAGKTERVSLLTGGGQANGRNNAATISGNDRFVAFLSDATNLVPDDTNGKLDIFVHDRQRDVTERVSLTAAGGQSQPNAGNQVPSISRDGRFVAFLSDDPDLVPNDTNGLNDVFVRDRLAPLVRARGPAGGP